MAAKLVICNRLAKGHDRRATQNRWRYELGPSTLALQDELGFDRYAQLHCVQPLHPLRQTLVLSRTRPAASLVALTTAHPSPAAGGGPLVRADSWTVLDELWWPSVDALLAAADSDVGLAALRRLRALRSPFTRRTAAVVCDELVIDAPKDERPDTARVSFCLRPRPQDTPDEMQTYWREEHAPLVSSLSDGLGFDQYDQARAVLGDPRAEAVIEALGGTQERPYLGFASLSFPTVGDLLRRSFGVSAQKANLALMRDELAFIQPPACPTVLGTRVPIA